MPLRCFFTAVNPISHRVARAVRRRCIQASGALLICGIAALYHSFSSFPPSNRKTAGTTDTAVQAASRTTTASQHRQQRNTGIKISVVNFRFPLRTHPRQTPLLSEGFRPPLFPAPYTFYVPDSRKVPASFSIDIVRKPAHIKPLDVARALHESDHCHIRAHQKAAYR